MKKFELTSEFITNAFGMKLFRIKALVEFGNVDVGELGGFVEKEDNLSQSGDAWVYGDARVSGNAEVYGNAGVYGGARVSGDAWVYGDAVVSGDAWVFGNARVYGDARVCGDAVVCGDAWVFGNARVYGDARVSGDAVVSGDADYSMVKGFGSVHRNTTFFRCKDGNIKVVCGCFFGTIPEFREKVINSYGDKKLAKEYLMIADLMDMHFNKEDKPN